MKDAVIQSILRYNKAVSFQYIIHLALKFNPLHIHRFQLLSFVSKTHGTNRAIQTPYFRIFTDDTLMRAPGVSHFNATIGNQRIHDFAIWAQDIIGLRTALQCYYANGTYRQYCGAVMHGIPDLATFE